MQNLYHKLDVTSNRFVCRFLSKKFNYCNKKAIIIIWLAIFLSLFSLETHAQYRYLPVGDKLQYGIPIAALLISLAKEDYIGSSQAIEGAFWTAAETHTLKALIDSERPNGMDNNSFPSGHTSAAFQGAAFLQMRYGWAYGAPAYALASFVGYTRIKGKYHRLRDVVAGATLAIGTQYVVTKMKFSLTDTFIAPVIDSNYYGLTFSTSF